MLFQLWYTQFGVAVAAAFLVPQFLWGWDSAEALKLLVAPMCGGMFLFDLSYIAALVVVVKDAGDGSHD